MNFNSKKILLFGVISLSLFFSYSSAMSNEENRTNLISRSISANVRDLSIDLVENYNINYFADNIRGSSQWYFRENPDSLRRINGGQDTRSIAIGLYSCLELDNSPNRSLFIEKISETLLSFKSRSLRESIRHFIYKSGNISSIAVSGIAGLFLLWGVLTKIIDGDNIGIKVAICSGLVLFITLKIRNIAFN